MPWAAAIGAAATLGSAAINSGGGAGSAQQQQAADFRQQASQLYDNLTVPSFNTGAYTPQSAVGQLSLMGYNPFVGNVTPLTEMANAGQLSGDQMGAISALQGIANTGLSASQATDAQNLNNSVNSAFGRNNQAIIDRMRAQGIGDRGATLAAQLGANQGAAMLGNQQGNNLLQTALQNQLSAISAGGQMATNVRGQEAGIANQQAQIMNNFNQMVAQLKTGAAQNNAATQNQSTQANFSNNQNIANNNVGLLNTAMDRNNNLLQTGFGDTLNKVSGQANALAGQANQANAASAASAQNAANANSQIGSTVGALGTFLSNPTNQTKLSNLFGGGSNGNVSSENGGGTVTDYQGKPVPQDETY